MQTHSRRHPEASHRLSAHCGKPLGYGYIRSAERVDEDYVMLGDGKLDVARELAATRVFLTPLYDPRSEPLHWRAARQ